MEFEVRVLVDHNINPNQIGLTVDTQVIVPGDLVFLAAQSDPNDRTVWRMNIGKTLDKYLPSSDAGDTIVVLQGHYASYVYRWNPIHGWILEFSPNQGGIVPIPGSGDVNNILYVTGGLTYDLESTADLGIPGVGPNKTVYCGTNSGNQFLANPEINSIKADGYVAGPGNCAQSGGIRLSNGSSVVSRNAANTADISLIGIDNTNTISLGNNTQLVTALSEQLSDHLSVGSNSAQSGSIRIGNSQTVSSRNAANSSDVSLIKLDGYNHLILKDTTMPDTPVSGDLGKLVYVSAANTLALIDPTSLGINGILTTTTQAARDALSSVGEFAGCELITQDFGLTWRRPTLSLSNWYLVSPNPFPVLAVSTSITDITAIYSSTIDGQALVNGGAYLLTSVSDPGVYFYNSTTQKFDTSLFTTPNSLFANGFEVYVKYGVVYANNYFSYKDGSFLNTSNIANYLRTQTSIVNVSNSTAPWDGYVLTATSSTTAIWMPPGGGSGSLPIGNVQSIYSSNGATNSWTSDPVLHTTTIDYLAVATNDGYYVTSSDVVTINSGTIGSDVEYTVFPTPNSYRLGMSVLVTSPQYEYMGTVVDYGTNMLKLEVVSVLTSGTSGYCVFSLVANRPAVLTSSSFNLQAANSKVKINQGTYTGTQITLNAGGPDLILDPNNLLFNGNYDSYIGFNTNVFPGYPVTGHNLNISSQIGTGTNGNVNIYSGGTLIETLSPNGISGNTHQIHDIVDPTLPQDVVTLHFLNENVGVWSAWNVNAAIGDDIKYELALVNFDDVTRDGDTAVAVLEVEMLAGQNPNFNSPSRVYARAIISIDYDGYGAVNDISLIPNVAPIANTIDKAGDLATGISLDLSIEVLGDAIAIYLTKSSSESSVFTTYWRTKISTNKIV